MAAGSSCCARSSRPANVLNFPCGNIGVQMGGWFRKEIKTVEDLKGLRIRIGGIGGTCCRASASCRTQIPPGDIYPSMERGTIDAAEWIGPYDDEKLGFAKVAKFYYTPGWWEGSAMITTLVNAKAWESLPPHVQGSFRGRRQRAESADAGQIRCGQSGGTRRLIGSGTQLRAFPQPVLDACYKATVETYDDCRQRAGLQEHL